MTALGSKRIDRALAGLVAEPYPPRHQLHKYWGKKPANVLRALVELFTSPGARVLDPFAGSGVAVHEAAALGREVIGVDLNPIAVRLGALLVDPPDPTAFLRAARAIEARLAPLAAEVYQTRCPRCAAVMVARSFVWDGSELVLVEGDCGACGAKRAGPPTREDRALAGRAWPVPRHPDAPVPDAWQMKKLHRAGLVRMAELFTSRNRRMLATLLGELGAGRRDHRVRAALELTFTANLAQCSRMIADYRGRAGGPSWKVNSYWLPKRAKELNVLAYFMNRAEKTARALGDAAPARAPARMIRGDARALPLGDGTIDYVVTDPPYGGEGIQYGELSFLWNLWLSEPQPLDDEITFNPGRSKSLDDYGRDLAAAFAECRRVLVPRGFMTVAFANRDARVWDVLLGASRRAGFTLVTRTELARSRPGLTERVADGATTADALLHLRRT
ncbi:hypothetical protein L6R52_35335 [Myxococcota bacterium]|nr:hypothetical protein [Myxococcota bacterium]